MFRYIPFIHKTYKQEKKKEEVLYIEINNITKEIKRPEQDCNKTIIIDLF